MTRLKERYINEVTKVLQAKFGYANVMEIPKVERIVINMGVSDALPTLRRWILQFGTSR